MRIDDYKKGFHIGMHGLGFADGIAKKNTIDGFKFWYEHGIKFFETDIAFTDDDEIVLLAHEFNDRFLHRLEIYEKPIDGTWSKEYVKGLRLGNKKSNICFLFWDDLCDLIRHFDDCVFMLDLYEKDLKYITKIAKKVDELIHEQPEVESRVLLEFYTQFDIKEISKIYPQISIIACIQEKGYNFFRSISLADKCKELSLLQLDFISCPYKYSQENRDIISYCSKNNIGVLSFSRYDTKRRKKRSLGINVNLVDVYTGQDDHRKYSRIVRSIIGYVIHRARMIMIATEHLKRRLQK